MLQMCSAREVEKLRQNSVQQNQRLEAALQRITDLEAQLTKKEHLILEQKKLLENVKTQAKYVYHCYWTSHNGIEWWCSENFL